MCVCVCLIQINSLSTRYNSVYRHIFGSFDLTYMLCVPVLTT